MKTNREVFMEKLQESSIEDFIHLTTGGGKCLRCSNYFWDGNYTGCHKNINDSSCEAGIAEYLESEVGTNLQVKYNKKYGAFRSYSPAMVGKMLAEVLFQAGVVAKLEPPCEWCKKTDCVPCDRHWCNILDMSRAYALELTRPYTEDDFSSEASKARDLYKRYYNNDMIFISEILIPRIKEDELRVQAELLVKIINQMRDKE